MSSLIPWRGEMDRLRNEMERLYDRFFDLRPFRRFAEEGEWMPSVDVSETAKEIIVKAEIPGVEAKDIDVNLSGEVLTIKGERKREREEQEENFHRIERSYGSFFRSLRLPSEVDGEKIKASYKKGVLRITLPKAKKATAKKVEISAG
ncbi:MAG: Hsp20/alpha crystallin family protein [Desulfobacterota bacterium]|nr:Hsp20/alpha crystallin family protein [Thermodesulfobacteriota bacterium]